MDDVVVVVLAKVLQNGSGLDQNGAREYGAQSNRNKLGTVLLCARKLNSEHVHEQRCAVLSLHIRKTGLLNDLAMKPG